MSNSIKLRAYGIAAAIAIAVLAAFMVMRAPAVSYGEAADDAQDVTSEQAVGEYSLIAIHSSLGDAFDANMELTEENCTACHADYVEATDGYNLFYNPHADRNGEHFSNVKCYRCHSMTEDPVNWCTTCHNGLVLGEGWQALPLM